MPLDSEAKITMLELYNKITAQAWSMFDSEVEAQDEFEESVTTSIQKALTELWHAYKFPFKEKTLNIITRENKISYNSPIGNILTSISNGKKVYNVWYNGQNLSYEPDYRRLDSEKIGEPEKFYIKQDKLYIYPIPDDSYKIYIDYMTLHPACNEDGEEKATLENETDYINIPERYQTLFIQALMPLTMYLYLIASDSDENSSAYREQYEKALGTLIDNCKGIPIEKKIGW